METPVEQRIMRGFGLHIFPGSRLQFRRIDAGCKGRKHVVQLRVVC